MIESYVLGLATEAEQRECESLCTLHPEIAAAKLDFEITLEVRLTKTPVAPPEHVKHKIFQSLDIAEENTPLKKEHIAPVRKMNVWKWIAAASVILLLGAGYLLYYVRYENQQLLADNYLLKNKLVELNRNDAIMELHPIVQRPSIKWSTMVEPTNSGHCMAHVYWDSLSANTYLLLGNIPKPLSDKQFQLWALQDNQAVNLGLFDITKEGQLVQMKNLYKAKVFFITIEPKGGSTTPTLNAKYAVGEL